LGTTLLKKASSIFSIKFVEAKSNILGTASLPPSADKNLESVSVLFLFWLSLLKTRESISSIAKEQIRCLESRGLVR